MSKLIKTTCNACHTEITLDFGNASYEEAHKLIEQMDKSNRECPGFHVEFGGWRKRWNLDKALDEAYSDEEKKDSAIPYFAFVRRKDGHLHKFEGYDAEQQLESYLHSLKETYQKGEVIHITEKNKLGEIITAEDYTIANL